MIAAKMGSISALGECISIIAPRPELVSLYGCHSAVPNDHVRFFGGKTRRNRGFRRCGNDAPIPTEAAKVGAKVMGGGRPIFRDLDWDMAHRLGRNRRVQAAFFQG
jgi:hypothetical protein